MPALLSFEQNVPVMVERAFNGMAAGMVVALAAWLLIRLAPRPNSGTRFAVWFAVLLAIAVLPLSGVLPAAAWLGHPALKAAGSGSGASGLLTLPTAWAEGLFALWAVMAGACLFRVGAGLWHVRQLRKSCLPVDFAAAGLASLQPDFAAESVALCTSDQVRVPAAVGFFRPMVVIPGWTLAELSSAELNAVLLHELAHLKRRDDWTNLAQKLVKAVFFFHPAVWWVDRQLSLEREMACDDVVLAQTPNPRAYAQCLVRLAEKSVVRRGLAMAQAAVRGLRQTSARVAQIMDVNRSPAITVSRPAMYAVVVLSVVGLTALPHVPRLLAFEDAQPPMMAKAVPGVPGVSSVGTRDILASQARLRMAEDDKAEKDSAGTEVIASKVSRARKVEKAEKVDGTGKVARAELAGKTDAGTATGPDRVTTLSDGETMESMAGMRREERPVADHAVIAARLPLDSLQSSPTLLQATTTEFVEERVTPQGVVMIMQRQQVDAQGRVVWSMSVYRLTVFHPSDPAGVQVPPKKT